MRPGYIDNKEAVQKRLRRVEGQVRGIERMVEEDRYCIEILAEIVGADDPATDEEELLARLLASRAALPRRGLGYGVWSEEALVAEVTYDRALITFAARRGIDVAPHRFSHPQIERDLLEAALFEQGIYLDDAHPTLPADPAETT